MFTVATVQGPPKPCDNILNIIQIQAPCPLPPPGSSAWSPSVFLAGTCAPLLNVSEGGTRNWRTHLYQQLSLSLSSSSSSSTTTTQIPKPAPAPTSTSVTILNPERTDWDSSWTEHPSDPRFASQTAWELQAQRLANVLVFFFQENAKGAVTLLELGMALGRLTATASSSDPLTPSVMADGECGPAPAAAPVEHGGDAGTSQTRQQRIIVCCEPGFWKAGNILMSCESLGVPVCEDYGDLVESVRKEVLTEYGLIGGF